MNDQPLRILLVDDDEDYFIIIRDLLAEVPSRRFEMEWASTYDDALHQFARNQHDVYLLDYRLGDRNGLEILREALNKGCRAPIIFLTGQGDREIEDEAMKAGAADYLLKGQIDVTLLERTIRHAIERSQTLQAMARLATAVEQSAEAILITDTRGAIQYVNPAFERITGYTRQEILGQNPRLLQSGKHDARFYRDLWETLQDGKVWSGQFTNRKKDGTLFIADATISPVRDASGGFLNYVQVARDVSYQRQIEERLRQSQKIEAIGRLAGGVAHDFNNILTVMTGYCSLLMHKLSASDSLHKYVEEVQKATERATALTRQLLAFSRKQVLQPKVIDVNSILQGMEKMLRRLIGEDIELCCLLATDLARIKADPGQIEQVIMNLAVNARDAMPSGGTLTIRTSTVQVDKDSGIQGLDGETNQYVRVTVTDTGAGMSEQVKAHLFEPFFTTKEVGKGTGLGLATSYGIIQQSNGHIRVQSELGKGTTFEIYLPVVAGAAEATAGSESAPGKKGTETILVVEDEPKVRGLVVDVLRDSGYTVVEANNGVEGLRVAQQDPARHIDLVVTDVIMPQMSGKELAVQLRRIRPQTRVLFTSGYTDDALAQHGVLAPDIDFLEKPFTPSRLMFKVRKALENTVAV